MKTFLDNDNFTGAIPPFDGLPGSELLRGIVNFEPIGWSLPAPRIATILAVVLTMGIAMYQFSKTWVEQGRWEGVRNAFVMVCIERKF